MSFKVDPAGATVEGKTISDWTVDWWKWVINGPSKPFNPSDDTTGLLAYTNNFGSVFLLAGNDPFSAAGNNTTRTIIVQHGKPVLVPVLNATDVEGPGIPQASNPPVTSTVGLKQLAQDTLKTLTDAFQPGTLTLTIDGKSISGLQGHLETTDFFSTGTVRPGSLLPSEGIGVSPGASITVAKASGYFVMLEDLSRGVHTLTFGGTGINGPVSTTDHLVVV